MFKFAARILLILSLSGPAWTQTPAVIASRSFEVATIKLAEPLTPALVAAGKLHVGLAVDGARVDIGYASLSDLLMMAFKVKPYQISGPDWITTQRFDVLAKMPEGATKDDVPEMLQTLLAERFHLKFHRENRDHSVYALIVGKDGVKMKDAPQDTGAPLAGAPAAEPPKGSMILGSGDNQVQVTPKANGATVTSAQNGTVKMSMSPDGQMQMEMSKVAMPALADMLSRLVDRPVLDMTELKGNYQVALELSRDSLMAIARASGVGGAAALPAPAADASHPVEASDPSAGAIFSAVQKLGLKLDPRKAPVDVLIIDNLDKMPTAN